MPPKKGTKRPHPAKKSETPAKKPKKREISSSPIHSAPSSPSTPQPAFHDFTVQISATALPQKTNINTPSASQNKGKSPVARKALPSLTQRNASNSIASSSRVPLTSSAAQVEIDLELVGALSEAEEELPDLLEELERRENVDTVATPQSKGKGKERKHEEVFKPTRLPAAVDIGDPVYVKSQTCFFPAVLKDFRPAQTAQNRKENKASLGDRYFVSVYGEDGRIKAIKRNEIIFSCDEAIATCVVGMVEIYQAKPSDNPSHKMSHSADPITSSAAFDDLPREDQIRHISPHLLRIISETYEPSKWRTNMFFIQPEKLVKQQQYGGVSSDEIAEVIIPALTSWLTSLDAPGGSDRFQGLDEAQRQKFIEDVLVPECLIRLYILCDHELAEVADQEQAYNEARKGLRKAGKDDVNAEWNVRITELLGARRRMRRKMGLGDEVRTEVDIEKEKLENGGIQGWTGRYRKAGRTDVDGRGSRP